MYPRRQGRHGRQAPGLAMLMLAGQMMHVGVDRIPPVTLAGIVGQVVTFLKLLNVRLPTTSQACVSTFKVWHKGEWDRLLLSPFFHVSELHLYYNMVSFLWKGLRLERQFGSGYFLYMIAVFSVLTSCVVVALGYIAAQLFQEPTYLSQCAVGFSGVLFALKVVGTHYSAAETQRIMGWFPVPAKYACWAELIVIHLLVPQSSFMGHLAGILVGTAYVKGPLRSTMDALVPPAPSYTYRAAPSGTRAPPYGTGGYPEPSYTYRAAPSGTRAPPYGTGGYPEPSYTYRAAPSGTRAVRYEEEAPSTPANGNPWGAFGLWGQSRPGGGGHEGDTHPVDEGLYRYTGGLDEEEQTAQATRESLASGLPGQRRTPSAPPMDPDAGSVPAAPDTGTGPAHFAPGRGVSGVGGSGSRLYPDLSTVDGAASGSRVDTNVDDVRRRRLARLDRR